METRGRKRKTEEQKKLEGTARKDRQNECAPVSDMTMPMAPAWLTKEEFKIWKRLAPRLNQRGVLSYDDADSFGMFCFWLGKFIELKTNCPNDVHTITKCALQVDKLGAKFGYTPADRSSLKLEKPVEIDPFDALLKKKIN